MNRGPQSGAGSAEFAARLKARLGAATPDWLAELAQIADARGLKFVADELDYSRSTISQVISGKYPGDLNRVEQLVRGAFMGLTVQCPVLGEVGRDRCLSEQKKPFMATSAMRAQLFHSCRSGCPNARHTKDEEGGSDAD